ncbi:hypothetical protein AOQ84DRAFT_352423 [Glonium stellatum]|uniref:PXA domain-containing protein n=1 Tax=Glonium stellatum TaxID=574774 RepID=A0A8E2F8Q8_9PEZI|nr:hypothetical protein AOQ84DRAFT_352423 [Glonium stellatum]
MTDPNRDTSIPNDAEAKSSEPFTAADILEQPKATPETSNGAQDAQELVQALTDRALRFLATASNETLGACLVGLGATTYLVLGRVGLVLIGVVGGVVLHATWEGSANNNGGERARSQEVRRREIGLDVVHRVLDWRKNIAQSKDADQDGNSSMDVKLYSGKNLDYAEFRPETASALNEFTDAVIRDYVKWWYSPILPAEQSFPSVCRQTLTAFILSVSAHISRKRPADTFLDFVTNSSSILIVFFNELSSALAASPANSAPDAIDMYLQMKPDSNLANVLDVKHQEKKLGMVAEDILQSYLEPKTYNCRPAHVFLREILAKVVLEMTIASCSKAEWINGWIVYLLEEGEPELMNAIDAGVEQSAGDQLQSVTAQVKEREEVLKEVTNEEKTNTANHRRVVSRAQEAMDEAMREAQRLTQLIAEEDAKRQREQQNASSTSVHDDVSESTTQGISTPTSSQSDMAGDHENETAVSTNILGESPLNESSELTSAPSQRPQSAFTSFDQLIPSQPPTALQANQEKAAALTLYNANLSIFDDSMPGEKGTIRAKPAADYLIQIEPASSQHPGWMIARKFADFETLHEILRRISAISGAAGFTEAHATLPNWKGHTKVSLRGELERYLNDAVRFKPLAESEGLKRFLEKDNGLNRSPNASNKSGFPGIGWPTPSAFENMGKGMIDVLTKAPKEVAGGGKALLGGVTGVLGNVGSLGPKKSNPASTTSNVSRSVGASPAKHARVESTVSELPSHIRTESVVSSLPSKRQSQDSLRGSPIVDTQPAPISQMERRPSWNPEVEADMKPRPSSSSRSSVYARSSRDHSRAPSARESMDLSPVHGGDQILMLPPLPSDITDDYDSPNSNAPPLPLRRAQQSEDVKPLQRPSRASTTSLSIPPEVSPLPPRRLSMASTSPQPLPKPARPSQKTALPLSEQETQVTIELLFAVINELYTMSSAWQIRRTLLNAAKTFLLRPGNPQLDSIRQLLQSTVLDDNTSDTGIAFHLRKLRANTLPTEEELKAWPKEMSSDEKEKLRQKARRLLVERGMPQALTSVMGQAASGEALGKIFDCLQVEKVARGVIFGLMLQGLRAVTQ